MRKFLFAIICLLVASTAFATDWNGFGGNGNHTGYTGDDGPAAFDIKWFNSDSSGNSGSYGGPIIVDDVIYFGDSSSDVFAINATDGSQIWNYTALTYNIRSHMYVDKSDDALWVTTRASDGATPKVYKFNITDGGMLCNYSTGDAIYGTPVVDDELVYIADSDADLHGIWKNNCSLKWENSGFGGPVIESTVTQVGDILYLPLYAYGFARVWADNGTTIGTTSTSDRLLGTASFDGTHLYVGSTSGDLYKFWQNGTLACTYAFSGQHYNFPTIDAANGKIYFGSTSNNVYAMWTSNCSQAWTSSMAGSGGGYGGALGSDGTYYQADGNGLLYAFDSSDGTQLYNTTLSGTPTSLAISEDVLYIVQQDGNLTAYYETPPLQTNITACGYYDANDTTYVLQNDLFNAGPNGYCILLNGTNQVFNGNGYTIDGNDAGGTNYGIRVATGTDHVIHNVTISDYFGASIYTTTNNTEVYDTVLHSSARGFQANSNGDYYNVHNNVITGNRWGISHDQADNCLAEYNIIANSTAGDEQFYINDGTDCVFQHNTVTNVKHGAVFKTNAIGHTFFNNTFDTLTQIGIQMQGSYHNNLSHITIRDTGGEAIQIVGSSYNNSYDNFNIYDCDDGLWISSSLYNNFTNFYINNSNNYNIYWSTAAYNRVEDFVIENGGNSDLYVVALGTFAWETPFVNFEVNGVVFDDILYNADFELSEDTSTEAHTGYDLIGSNYFVLANDSAGFVWINISYDQGDVPAQTNESEILLWRYESSAWDSNMGTGTNGVDTVNNVVYANITSFDDNEFALFVPSYVPPTPPSPGIADEGIDAMGLFMTFVPIIFAIFIGGWLIFALKSGNPNVKFLLQGIMTLVVLTIAIGIAVTIIAGVG